MSYFRGKVTDGAGFALPGVTISKAGRDIGPLSDFDGHFTIQAGAGEILEFQYVGLPTMTLALPGDQ